MSPDRNLRYTETTKTVCYRTRPLFSDSFTVAYGIGNFESPSITIPRMVCTGRPFRPVVWLNTVTDTNKAVNNRIHPP